MKRLLIASVLAGLALAGPAFAFDDKGAHFFAGLVVGSLSGREILAAGCAGALKEAADSEWDNGDLGATVAGGAEAWVLKRGTDEQLYWSFVGLEFLQAGNMGWQQDNGYYEINPIYGRHPSRDRIYLTKAAECVFARIVAWNMDEPKRSTFLRWCHYAVLAMMAYDTYHNIPILHIAF